MTEPVWVLLRGLGREAAHWGTFPAALAARFPGARVWTPDLPGAGVRFQETSPTTVEGIVDAIRAEIPGELQGRPLCLLGLSLGSMVALSWAQRFPSQVAQVVLVSGSVAGLSPPWKRLRLAALPTALRVATSRDPQRRERLTLRITSHDLARQAQMLGTWTEIAMKRPVSRQTLRRQFLAATRFRPRMGSLGHPTLVVAGAEDRLVDPQCSRLLAEGLAVKLHLHPTAGHDLPLDAPDWLLELIENQAQLQLSQS